MPLTADQIQALREKTGAGILDCKKALEEAGGDLAKAQEILRKKGLADAAKKSHRTTKEGLIAAHVAETGDRGALVEVNCETDFVARTDDFKELARKLASLAADGNLEGGEALIKGAIAKVGENVALRRHESFRLNGTGRLWAYIHGGKAGTMVELGFSKPETASRSELLEVAKEVALQIVGASPKWVRREDVPAEVVAKEKEIFSEQLLKEGKPAPQIEKILPGKLEKFYSTWCLVDQPGIRDASGKTKVRSLLEASSKALGDPVQVRRFVRFQLGGE